MNRFAFALAFAVLAFAIAGCGGNTAEELRIVSATQTTTVSPTAPNGWTWTFSGASSAAIAPGPATPPLGQDSLHLKVDATGATAAQGRTTNYAGTLLADIDELSYSTFVTFNNDDQAPYLILNVDYDVNGTTDDLLFFEPVYQKADFFPGNDQGDVLLGEWQDWDALNGGWWSVNGTAGATPGTGVKSLADIIAAEPDAAIATVSAGAVRIVAGFGGPTDWGNFVGATDAFTIGVSGDTTIYDFELSTAADCKNDWQSLGYKNQGACVSAHKNKGQQGQFKKNENIND
jgi:hypothetical protein